MKKDLVKIKRAKRQQRHKRVRAKVFGTKSQPRLSVFRSNRHLYAQLIDDAKGKTLFGLSDEHLNLKKGHTKKEAAWALGKHLAKIAQEKKITKVVFDRGGFQYHGRIKALADGAREGGLKF